MTSCEETSLREEPSAGRIAANRCEELPKPHCFVSCDQVPELAPNPIDLPTSLFSDPRVTASESPWVSSVNGPARTRTISISGLQVQFHGGCQEFSRLSAMQTFPCLWIEHSFPKPLSSIPRLLLQIAPPPKGLGFISLMTGGLGFVAN